jgi:hypothetical protein
MHKKDYIKFAEMFAKYFKRDYEYVTIGENTRLEQSAREQRTEALMGDICDIFKKDNPSFDKVKFLKAVYGNKFKEVMAECVPSDVLAEITS